MKIRKDKGSNQNWCTLILNLRTESYVTSNWRKRCIKCSVQIRIFFAEKDTIVLLNKPRQGPLYTFVRCSDHFLVTRQLLKLVEDCGPVHKGNNLSR